MTISEHNELIQVAAVAVASLENLEFGYTDDGAGLETGATIFQVADERGRQDKKWGIYRSHSRIEWAMILAEELGEWANELDLYDPAIEKLPNAEQTAVRNTIELLRFAEVEARWFNNNHRWPDQQQQVIDKDLKTKG